MTTINNLDLANFRTESQENANRIINILNNTTENDPIDVNRSGEPVAADTEVVQTFIQKHGFKANAGIAAIALLAQTLTNHALHNTALGAKAQSDGNPLIANMVFSSFIANMVKGNWKHVDSHKQQLAVLASLVTISACFDAISGAIIQDTGYVGPTTLITANTAFAYIVKMLAYGVLNKPTYVIKEGTVITALDPRTLKIRKAINAAFLTLLSGGAAAGNFILPLGSAPNVIMNLTYSQAFNKIVGKAGLKDVANKKHRLLVVFSHLLLAISASAVVGAIITNSRDNNDKVSNSLETIGYHYLGPVTAIALSSTLTNTMIRACQKPKNKPNNPNALTPAKKEKKVSFCKQIKDITLYTAVTLGGTIAHSANNMYLGASKTVSLGIKQCQSGWGFHSAREILKGVENDPQRMVAFGTGLTLAAGMGIVSSYLDPTLNFAENPLNASVFAITAGNVSTFFGKWVRNKFLPKENH